MLPKNGRAERLNFVETVFFQCFPGEARTLRPLPRLAGPNPARQRTHVQAHSKKGPALVRRPF